MNTLLLIGLRIYKLSISPLLHQMLGSPLLCRFSPSCSQYAAFVVGHYGVWKGGWLALKRLLSCQPFAR